MNPKPQQIIQFLVDEGIDKNIKTKNLDSLHWKINFDEPWLTGDSKRRCNIFHIRDNKTNEYVVVFNSFKAVARLDDELYKGSFWKFVKLIKEFESVRESKFWFIRKYILKKNLSEVLNEQNYANETTPKYRNKSVELPENCIRYNYNNDKCSDYSDYLISRNVSNRLSKNYKIFIDINQKRIVFPVYEDKELIFYTGRAIKNSFMPWLKSDGDNVYPIWNLENVNGDVIYIFEGILDAIMVPNGIAILGSMYTGDEIVKKILYKKYLKINIILDNDIPGHKAKIKLAKKLSQEHNNVFIYNFKGIKQKDFNQMKMEGINFDFDDRLFPWNLKTEAMIKIGVVI